MASSVSQRNRQSDSKMNAMNVLAIESTCDETAAAVVRKNDKGVQIIKSVVASSMERHKKYGGIVPEVAAREQIKSIIPVIAEAIGEGKVDAVAVSYGPGLMGSLLVGVETAKVLAWAWKIPLIKVNHLTAHILANWLNEQVPELPAVGLVVSGGHTDLILLESMTEWRWIGGTRDDAVGEAFDKTARILGLPYPGGPEIDKASEKIGDEEFNNHRTWCRLPRPLIHEAGLSMSFSGIKAAMARLVETEAGDIDSVKTSIMAREFSEAVIDVLISKTLLAIENYHPKSVIMAGGVAANKKLRESMRMAVESISGVKFYVPEIKYCGDNAAMVGAAAILRPDETTFELKPDPSLSIV